MAPQFWEDFGVFLCVCVPTLHLDSLALGAIRQPDLSVCGGQRALLSAVSLAPVVAFILS